VVGSVVWLDIQSHHQTNHNDVFKPIILIVIMIYLLTAIGLSPDGISTVHIYTQTIYRTIQNKQYIEQHNNFGRVRAVPRLG
jgi:hypothetical protein